MNLLGSIRLHAAREPARRALPIGAKRRRRIYDMQPEHQPRSWAGSPAIPHRKKNAASEQDSPRVLPWESTPTWPVIGGECWPARLSPPRVSEFPHSLLVAPGI